LPEVPSTNTPLPPPAAIRIRIFVIVDEFPLTDTDIVPVFEDKLQFAVPLPFAYKNVEEVVPDIVALKVVDTPLSITVSPDAEILALIAILSFEQVGLLKEPDNTEVPDSPIVPDDGGPDIFESL
jgi:hypothetical protein